MAGKSGQTPGLETTAVAITGAAQTVRHGDSVLNASPFPGWPDEYVLEARLPRTGQGQVFRARRADGLQVAIKRVPLTETRELIESHALQAIESDGVARFVEERQLTDDRLLITQWVEGRPFPGVAGTLTWRQLEPLLRGLLNQLDQVHAYGYVHRDLKPGNVLVHDERVVILDFGLAWAVDGPGITRPGVVMGTPVYLAPEQLENQDVPRFATDLWAVGVMAFEALTGALPFSRQTWRARAVRRAPRLAEWSGLEAPRHVLRCLDTLLNRKPADRPQSCAAVLHALEHPERPARLVWVGSRALVDQCVAKVCSGGSARLVAPTGMGRTRMLTEIAEGLTAENFQLQWCTPDTPSLKWEAIPTPPADLTWVRAKQWSIERMQSWLSAGKRALLVDDWQAIAPSNQAVIEACMPYGSVVAVHPSGDGRVLQPMTQADLMAWFDAPERILRIPSRAAQRLRRGTGGRMRLIAARLQSWQQRNLIGPSGHRWSMQSAQLAELPWVAPVASQPGRSGPHADVLAWLTAGEGSLTPRQLASAMGCGVWQLEAALDALKAQDAIFLSDGRPIALTSGDWPRWTLAERRTAHQRIAEVCESAEDVYRHQWLADPANAVAALLAMANQALDGGRIETTRAVCDVVLKQVIQRHLVLEPAERNATLHLLARVALIDGRQRLICTARQKLEASGSQAHQAEILLLRHFEATRKGPPAVPVDALERLGRLAPDLERFRIHALMELADNARQLLEQRAHFEALAEAVGPAMLAEVRARLAYRSNEFAVAEDEYLTAAFAWTSVEARASAWSRAASSAMEAFAPERAREHLRQAEALSCGFEHPHLTARLAWLDRAIAHRLRVPSTTDEDLLVAMYRLKLPKLTSLVLVAECGLAWQRGDLATMGRLAGKAEALFAQREMEEHVALCRAARFAAGETGIDPMELMRCAEACEIEGIGIQILGLSSAPGAACPRSIDVRHLLKGIPEGAEHVPIDLLDAKSALTRIGLDPGME